MAGRDRAFTGAFALIVSATACAIVVLATPRPVLPSQLPSLRLDGDALARQRNEDEASVGRAPRGPDVDALLAAYLDEGRAERSGPVRVEAEHARRRRTVELAEAVFARAERDEARALLVAVTSRALRALWGELSDADEARGLLGHFPKLLARYGYVDADGRLLAPELAVRTLYAARFNLLCGRGLLTDLTELERTAHDGWTALHVGALEPAQRADAARSFHALGGRYGAEADAIWRFQGGDAAGAAELLGQAYAGSGLLRLRNLALGASGAPTISGIWHIASNEATTLSR
ncbi:MAG: hypothetical protein ABW252_11745 [Polyangiales bacterium]